MTKDLNMNTIDFNAKLLLGIIFTLLLSQNSWAQENIATARPTLSIGSWVLPENSFQYEQGAQYVDISGENWAYDAFFRASISKSTEIRILIPSLEYRFAALEVKWMMMKPEGNKPGVGFSINMSSFGDNLVVAGYRMAIEKSLTDNLVGFINVGKLGDGFFGDLTLAYALGDKVTVVGEYWHHEEWQQIQTGITYLINSETQIDINGGLLFNAANDYTFGVGVARRFKMKYTREEN